MWWLTALIALIVGIFTRTGDMSSTASTSMFLHNYASVNQVVFYIVLGLMVVYGIVSIFIPQEDGGGCVGMVAAVINILVAYGFWQASLAMANNYMPANGALTDPVQFWMLFVVIILFGWLL
jgi:hypothetical protein